MNKGGRPKGSINKATAELKALAQEYSEEALDAIVDVLRNGDSHSVKLQAAQILLDRGFGKPTQMVATDEEAGGFSVQVVTGVPRD
jgi:phage gp46-like protein